MIFRKEDFAFAPFKNEGDSGELYLAVRKSDKRRFIVKHEFSDCACNEFVYFSVAKELGLKTLDFHLFEKDDKKRLFTSGYAIGIEYIDAIEFQDIIKQKKEIKNWQDYFGHFLLYNTFLECDSFEMLLDKDGFLYRIDTTAAFIMSYYFIDIISKMEICRHFYEIALQKDKDIIDNIILSGNKVKENYGADGYEPFYRTVKDLAELPQANIERILDNLCLVYPQQIKQYYMNFFESCQKACKTYLL